MDDMNWESDDMNWESDGSHLVESDTVIATELEVKLEGLSATVLNNYNGRGTVGFKVFGTLRPAHGDRLPKGFDFYYVQAVAYDDRDRVLGMHERQFYPNTFFGLAGFAIFVGELRALPHRVLVFPRVE